MKTQAGLKGTPSLNRKALLAIDDHTDLEEKD